MTWQKPSKQFCDTAACAEVTWKSPCESAHCLETAHGGAGILLRASGAPETMVELTNEEFSVFVQAVKAGEYDGYIA